MVDVMEQRGLAYAAIAHNGYRLRTRRSDARKDLGDFSRSAEELGRVLDSYSIEVGIARHLSHLPLRPFAADLSSGIRLQRGHFDMERSFSHHRERLFI
jgi:hypothetical protein